jgi:integrase
MCWIEVHRSVDNSGRVKKPKSGHGRVVIPEWLFSLLVGTGDWPQILPNSLYKWCKRRGLQPHGLRHFYATYLVRNVPNVEIARRQLRHANLATTLQVYVEVQALDEMQAIAGLGDPFAA